MINDKGILIKNIYYMLAYAFQVLRQSNYEEIETEDFENVHDLFAAILSKGIARQLKQGLYRKYVKKVENMAVMHGKLDVQGTIHNCIQRKQVLSCEFDELSENNIYNQILKTTMICLLKQNNVKAGNKVTLKKELLFFDGIDMIEPSLIHWNMLHFEKNNQNYHMLMNICNLVLEGLLLSNEKGMFKTASFLDEQRMCRLYEKFVLEYYRYHHPEFSASAAQIPWNLDNGIIDFLPVMQTDITLKYRERVLIIDAKYYAHTLQTQFSKQTLHSNNLYQIFTYVKNLDKNNTGNVGGMLLYAKTGEQIQPNNDFSMSGNMISVKTLDLNQPFGNIAEQLEQIAERYLLC